MGVYVGKLKVYVMWKEGILIRIWDEVIDKWFMKVRRLVVWFGRYRVGVGRRLVI